MAQQDPPRPTAVAKKPRLWTRFGFHSPLLWDPRICGHWMVEEVFQQSKLIFRFRCTQSFMRLGSS